MLKGFAQTKKRIQLIRDYVNYKQKSLEIFVSKNKINQELLSQPEIATRRRTKNKNFVKIEFGVATIVIIRIYEKP